jgi:hypothetical protein
MWADSIEELHQFAARIPVKRCWFHGVRKGHPHYDVNYCQRKSALDHGAIKSAWKEFIKNNIGFLNIKPLRGYFSC